MDFIKSLILNINYKLLLIVGVFLLLLNSCKENELYSNIPAIDYKTAYILKDNSNSDSLLKLVFSFKDGDGDIGLNSFDTLFPFNPLFDSVTNESLNDYYFNCYIGYKEKVNGVYYPFITPGTNDTFEYKFRVQNLTPEGRHKAIRGELELDLFKSPSQQEQIIKVDTIIYSIFIYDRSLNKSNLIETPPIIWRR